MIKFMQIIVKEIGVDKQKLINVYGQGKYWGYNGESSIYKSVWINPQDFDIDRENTVRQWARKNSWDLIHIVSIDNG